MEIKDIKDIRPNKGKEINIGVGGETYARYPIKTPLINPGDSLEKLINDLVEPYLQQGDLIFISEKVVAISQKRIIPIKEIKPSGLARFLSRNVKNNWGTKEFRGFGHGTPMAMELFIREAGVPRVVFAAGVAAITRPLGLKGAFYALSGKRAKSVDCPMSFILYPYTQYAKLAPLDPNGVAKKLKEKFGNEVVIVDANYRGVYSLGKSTPKLTERFIHDVFRDNPLGQSDEQTPFCIVRSQNSKAY
ncbi:MAG: coenzyme F420-0:L-glutamate ligase [Patescibacteria group bacterium]|nr:coenzyme F420-0:L-glutamate ligase [Patescibacteria group bacterium]